MAVTSARSASKPSLSHPGNTAHVAPSGNSIRVPAKYALLIGCRYRGNGSHHELEQTHEDVHKMKHLLMNVYNFEETNITVLLDDGRHQVPNRDNIIKAMEELVYGRKAEDEMFLHYSGHGEQTKCAPDDDTEPDGLDEAIVPCDATRDKETWIIDNEMREILVCKIPVDAQLTAFFDMCHSGTILDLEHYCYNDELPESGRSTKQATIHICKRTSHDKVEGKIGNLSEMRPLTTAARTDSEDNKAKQGVRRFSYSMDTKLCEYSEASGVSSSSGVLIGKTPTIPQRSGSCSSCGGSLHIEEPPFIPERPNWQRSMPHRRSKIMPAINDMECPPVSRRYTEPPSPGPKVGCLSTLRSLWLSRLQKGFCRPGNNGGVKINRDETPDALIREGTSTSITPLMSPTPVPSYNAALFHPLPSKTRSTRNSMPAALNAIDEDREMPLSRDLKYGHEIARCLSPISSPSSQESLPALGLAAEALALSQTHTHPAPNVSVPPERKGKCNCRPRPAPAHGQVICISAALDEQMSWETPKGSLTSALVDILEKDAHPTYKGLLGSMQTVLNKVSDNLRQEHIHSTKHIFMANRKKPKRTKTMHPSRSSASSSRRASTKSRKSGDNVGEDFLFAMEETVRLARGGPVQKITIGTEKPLDINAERFMKRHFCRNKRNSSS